MTSLPDSLHPSIHEKETDALQTWREVAFGRVIRAIGIAASVAYIANLLLNYKILSRELLLAYTVSYLLIMIAAFLPRIPTVYRTSIFVAIIFAVGLIASIQYAAIGDGRVWFILSVFLTIVFLGRRAGLVVAFASAIAWGVMGYLFTASILPPPEINQFTFAAWAGTTVSLFIVGITATLSIGTLLVNLSQNIKRSSSLARKSEEQSRVLEEQHALLERRSSALGASAKISRKLASLIDYQDILNALPKLLAEAFDLSSAAVFLLETENVLRLASSIGWNEQAHSKGDYILSLNEDIVGMAVVEGAAYTGSDSEIKLNMALDDTRSFVAIPLRGREEVLGALVLQSEVSDVFGHERVSILQTFADQIALLLENADLLAQKESALEAERRAYGKITQAAWKNISKSQNLGAYRRDENGLTLVPAKSYRPEAKDDGSEKIPISIRGKVIGFIDAQKPKNRAWTASEKELLRILGSRLETAMDSARLYQDSQQQAERERTIADISSQVRESLEIEGVLEAAARELRNSLGVAEAEVWLNAENNSVPENGNDKNVEKSG